MRYKYLLLLITTAAFFPAKRQTTAPPPPPPPPPTVLLKQIVIPRLPSPFYYFEYNTAGRVTFASFASGLNMYNVVYDRGRISEMRNNIAVNKDRLQYIYDNAGKVSVITYADSTGMIYTRIYFTYDGQQLIKLEREVKSGPGFIIDKTVTFSYQADGNLQELREHRPPINGQNEATYVDRFEQYDNKINTDGFSLIHDEFFDHLILLPEVHFQKNNPGKVIHTGDGPNYNVDYTYTYNDKNLPLTKTGELIYLTGPDAGKKFQTNSTFSYY